jgi:hypothetical protein
MQRDRISIRKDIKQLILKMNEILGLREEQSLERAEALKAYVRNYESYKLVHLTQDDIIKLYDRYNLRTHRQGYMNSDSTRQTAIELIRATSLGMIEATEGHNNDIWIMHGHDSYIGRPDGKTGTKKIPAQAKRLRKIWIKALKEISIIEDQYAIVKKSKGK